MENTEVKKKSTIKKVLDVLYYILIVLILGIAITYTAISFSTKDGVTSIFGYVVSSVQTNSMSGTFEEGDVIVTKKIDGNDAKVDDVISFYYMEPQSEQVIIVTHRVKEVRDDGKLVMQGDVAESNNSKDFVEVISRGDVIAEYTGVRIPGLGKVTDFLSTKVGFFCCILIPVFLFLFWQIYVFIKTLMDAQKINREKQVNDQARAIAEQMLKEMNKTPENTGETDTTTLADVE